VTSLPARKWLDRSVSACYSESSYTRTMSGCKACHSCLRFKPFEEFYNCKNSYDKKLNQCKKCNIDKGQSYRESNREKERVRNREYGRQNAQVVRSRVAKWRKNNPGKARAIGRLREARNLQACPLWAEHPECKKEILSHYLHAEWLESVTGEVFHVDHIVPLQNDFVCGLHVPWNLMVLSADDNQSKNGYWWPEQLDCQKGRGSSHAWWRELELKVSHEK